MRSFAFLVVLALSAVPLSSDPTARPSLSEPALAPDRPEVVFVSGGDIWTVPLEGGEAHLLISNPATESRPLYSPDGKRLAFMSTRSGSNNIYVFDFATGDTPRVTYDDAPEHLDAWSRDGKYLYFSSSTEDISRANDILRIKADGGTPMPVAADRFLGEYWAAPSPDGGALLITAKGMPAAQWWRHGHSHIDESEIWTVRPNGSTPEYSKVTGDTDSKEVWPMWSADGKRVYYVSDRSGAENLWVKDATGKGEARKLTDFSKGRLLWPQMAYDGKTIVFERDFDIWKFDVASSKALKIPVTLRGAPAGPATTHVSLNNRFRDMELSPDNKKVAFVAHGEVFAVSAKDGGNAARVTTSDAAESSVTWAPDSKRLVYVSDRDGAYHLYLYDFGTNSEARITDDPSGETAPRWSPDGKLISFVRGGKQICVYDPEKKQARQLASGVFGRPSFTPIEWSPDSEWVAYAAPGERLFRNIYVVPAAGGTPRVITFIPNTGVNGMAWSPDGTYLLISSGQRTEPNSVLRIDLVPKTPKFREDQFRDLFKDELPVPPSTKPPPAEHATAAAEKKAEPPAAEAKKKSPLKVVITFEGIRRRVRELPIGLDADALEISPDGKTLLFRSSVAGQQNLYTYSLDELAKEPAVARQLTSTPGVKTDAQWTSDSKTVYYLESGRIQSMSVESRQAKPVAAAAELDVDFAKEKMEVFAQAWRYLNDNFYDPEFHGLDWKATRAVFEPQVAGARTEDELRRIISLMLGELNASHLGISAGGGSGDRPQVGKVGLRFDRAEYESSGRFKISDVVSLSPAEVAGIRRGEYLIAVDGTLLNATSNFERLLQHKVGKRVVLTVAASASGDSKREVPVHPVNTATEKQLAYRDWVEGRREYVSSISKGRLGYVHMPDMSSDSLRQLYFDLDTDNQAKEGVVIDIRSNNGGFVNAYALDVLTRRPYLNMAPRDLPPAPARTVLGQRALERPTVLVTNMESLSDAEDFTEGYRAMKLGKVVGEPTAGWIIYTGGVQLIDGSVLRLPSVRITTGQGVTMERNPRPVDLEVTRAVGESYSGKDAQLEAAVKQLLGELDRSRGGSKLAAR